MLPTVFVAGAAGAVCRYLLDGFVQERWNGPFPMGTFVVNIAGAFLLGTLTGYLTAHASMIEGVRVGLGTGFLGGFTTFSTLTFESLRLLREGSRRYAVVNLFGSTIAGLVVASLGLAIGSTV